MADDWAKRAIAETRSRRLLEPGETVMAAFSGGPDSTALLHLLCRAAASEGWTVRAAHFNHQLRGPDSEADEEWVRAACANLGAPLEVGRGDVAGQARAQGISVEMAGRRLRHQFFAEAARRTGAFKVALGHHADDQVELFFLRLFQGSGGKGAGGMRREGPSPVDPAVRLIRPLLGARRAEIEEYLARENIECRRDASNESLDPMRNRIRREVLPFLRRSLSRPVDELALRHMEVVGAENEFVATRAIEWLESRSPPFDDLHRAVQREVIRTGLLALGGTPTFERIESLRGAQGRVVEIGKDFRVWRDAEGTIRRVSETEASNFNGSALSLRFDKDAGVADLDGVRVRWSIEESGAGLPEFREGEEWFDAARVGERAVLRHWAPGDRFQPIGMRGQVKLQDLFTNEKVSAGEKRRRVLAVSECGEIFWVEGLRIGDRFKLDKLTAKRLKWQWQRQASPLGIEPVAVGGSG